jgi:ParB-like chromosome segregation protein Spo0J
MLPHPYAELFPMMGGEAMRELVASIRDDGLEQPIVTFEGKILDGRNRDLACANAQVEPRYVKYKGDDPLGYILRVNLIRRHLTTSQRAMVAANLANLELGDNQHTKEDSLIKPPSIKDAAEKLNVSPDSVKRAKKITDHGDKVLIEKVEKGDITINKAVEKITKANPAPEIPIEEIQSGKLLRLWDKTGVGGRKLFLQGIGATA